MKQSHIVGSLILLICFAGIVYVYLSRSKDEISPNEARQNVQKGKYDYIVDVRTEKEWNEGHLANTIHIPIGSLVQKLPEKIPNKDSQILFVCRKGIRASGVVTIARKMGYKNVQSMIGNYKELTN